MALQVKNMTGLSEFRHRRAKLPVLDSALCSRPSSRNHKATNLKPIPTIIRGALPLILASSAWAATEGAGSVVQEVIVAGKIRTVQTSMDRKVYTISNDILAVNGAAADVLNTIPSVTVDADGNISLRGDAKVLVLVDGRPSAQLSGARAGDGFSQFAASDIERIEVMTTAPAQYKAEGSGGAINIVTRTSRKHGTAGSLLASAGNRGRYVLAANAAFNTEQLKLHGTIGLRQDDRERVTRSQLSKLDADPVQTSVDQRDEHIRRQLPSLKGSLDYQLSASDALAADLSLRERSGKRNFDQTTEAAQSSVTRHSDGHEWSLSGEQRLGLKHHFNGSDDLLELSLHRSTDVERERYAYLNTYRLPAPGYSADHLYLDHDFATIELAADYRTRLGEQRVLRLGVNWQHDDNGFGNVGDNVDPDSGLPVPNPDLSNEFRYRQTIQAAYLSLEQTVGPWAASFGIRAEHTASQGDQLTTRMVSAHRYGGLYPSLHLEQTLTGGTALTLGASRRLARPDQEDLNPFTDHQDVHNLRAGNPDLMPQDTQSFEAGLRRELDKRSYGISAYLRRNRNSTTDVVQLLAPDVLLATKTNLRRSSASGLEFHTDASLSATLSYRLNGNLFHSQIDPGAYGVAGSKSANGLNLKGSLDYRPSQVETAQLSFSRADKRLTPQGQINPVNLVNIGYKRQLHTGLSLVATLSDVFNGQRFVRELATPVLRQRYQRQQIGRVAYLGLSYQFGIQKKAKAAGFDYEQ